MTDLIVPTWTVGERMKKARETAGYSPAQMAELLGVGVRSLHRWESGKAPKRMTMTAWAYHTSVPLEWLETGQVDELPTGRYGAMLASGAA